MRKCSGSILYCLYYYNEHPICVHSRFYISIVHRRKLLPKNFVGNHYQIKKLLSFVMQKSVAMVTNFSGNENDSLKSELKKH